MNTKEKLNLADAVITETASTNSASSAASLTIAENLKPVSAVERILAITAVSLKVTADIQKDLNLPKNASLKGLLKFFKSMSAKKGDTRTRNAYEKTVKLMTLALENGAELTKYYFNSGKLTAWLKFEDFKKARQFVEFLKTNG